MTAPRETASRRCRQTAPVAAQRGGVYGAEASGRRVADVRASNAFVAFVVDDRRCRLPGRPVCRHVYRSPPRLLDAVPRARPSARAPPPSSLLLPVSLSFIFSRLLLFSFVGTLSRRPSRCLSLAVSVRLRSAPPRELRPKEEPAWCRPGGSRRTSERGRFARVRARCVGVCVCARVTVPVQGGLSSSTRLAVARRRFVALTTLPVTNRPRRPILAWLPRRAILSTPAAVVEEAPRSRQGGACGNVRYLKNMEDLK